MKKRRFKTAFILGAGLGTRLRPLTDRCPKPLLPLRGRPIITFAMDHLANAGIDRFIVNTHHCPESYVDAFPDGQWQGIPIHFSHEPTLLDTAGGLKNIEYLLDTDESILCYNGDILSDIPLDRLTEAHEHNPRRPDATLALRSTGTPLNISIDTQSAVCDIRYTLGNPGISSFLFTGIYTVETSILQYIKPKVANSVIDLFLQRIISKTGSVSGVVIDEGQWYDIGTVDVYEELNNTV